MRVRSFLVFIAIALPLPLVSALGAGCGPSVQIDTGEGGSGGDGSSVSTFVTSSSSGPGGADGGIGDATPDYVDPGCPDAGPPITAFECDPYKQNNGDCGPGEGCYIFVQYPNEPCGQEVYGAVCAPSGPGKQGDPCGGLENCAAGHACVVSGSGTQCVLLCKLEGNDGCPPGLVCEPIDVEGFGGCL